MRLAASDIYVFHRPSKCPLRLYLKHHNVEPSPPSPFEQVIERLGQEHEHRCLARIGPHTDLGGESQEQRVEQTKKAVAEGATVYHGFFAALADLGGQQVEIVGEPDFLIGQMEGHIVRDAKMSRRITEKDHPEILAQVGLYGWLYERTMGHTPLGLQVHAGTGEIVDLPYDGGRAALDCLAEIVAAQTATSEPYSPVGWSKCVGCGYRGRCWPQAEGRRDVALLPGVDQGLAAALRGEGVQTYDQLLDRFDQASLTEFRRPFGQRMQKVGKKAAAILRAAEAMAGKKEILLQPPDIPEHDNYVMFDLEGLPPHLDETGKIYLWGTQVFGKQSGQYTAATAGFGEDGDRQGWEDFLANAQRIFEALGDIPFVHWAIYERVHLDEYMERYGDRDGVAARVRANLLDLLPITQKSIALPLPSYSLKVIEKHIGFKRTQDEYGGDWSMAKYIEATEMQVEAERKAVMDQILVYNEEDLKATWAVLEWLRSKQL